MSHEWFLGMSYAALGVALVVEIAFLRWRRARALKLIELERDLETQD